MEGVPSITDTFDIIILGTGITQSILSAALSRIGKKVIHLDSHSFYGEYVSNFNLLQFHNLLLHNSNSVINIKTNADANVVGSSSDDNLTLYNCVVIANQSNHIGKEEGEVTPTMELQRTAEWIKAAMEWRQYNIDLSPKLLYSCAQEVEILVQSAVAKYLEFRPIDAVYLYYQDQFVLVPCSKGDVFKSKHLSLVEKRYLSKFIAHMRDIIKNSDKGNNNNNSTNDEETFVSFLETFGLSIKLQAFILYAIAAISTDQTKKENQIRKSEGLKMITKFIESLGRYGNTPFIIPLYGSSEMCQAYCRLSAVYGGVYVLRRSIAQMHVTLTTNTTSTATTTESQTQQESPTFQTLPNGNCYKVLDSERECLSCSQAIITDIPYLQQIDILTASDISSSSALSTPSPTPLTRVNLNSHRSFVSRCVCITEHPINVNFNAKANANVNVTANQEIGEQKQTDMSKETSTEVDAETNANTNTNSDTTLPSSSNQVLLVIPPGAVGNLYSIYVLQLSFEMCVCPNGKYVIHFTTPATNSAKEDLLPAVEALFNLSSSVNGKPSALYCGFFNSPSFSRTSEELLAPTLNNVFACSDTSITQPAALLHSEPNVTQAMQIFQKLCPNQVFLPTAHSEEDLVWEDEAQ